MNEHNPNEPLVTDLLHSIARPEELSDLNTSAFPGTNIAPPPVPTRYIEEAFDMAISELKAAMDADPDFNWSWRCNLAVSGYDAGAQADKASRQAADFICHASGLGSTSEAGRHEQPPGHGVSLAEHAIGMLKAAMAIDHDYARSWHDNRAMMAYDAGAPHGPTNKHAAGFMKRVFDVDTSNFKAHEPTTGLTEDDIRILNVTLGIGRQRGNKNFFLARQDQLSEIQHLVELGMAIQTSSRDDLFTYQATEKGMDAIGLTGEEKRRAMRI